MDRLIKSFVGLASLILLLVVQVGAVTLEETVKKTIEVDEQELLSLENKNGKIQIDSWDNNVVEIIAHKKVSASSRSRAEALLENLVIRIDQTPDAIDVKTILPRSNDNFDGLFSWIFNGGNSGASVRYEIKVPRKFDLNIHSTNGSISAEECSGRLRFETTNGNIKAEEIRGLSRCRTTNGSVSMNFAEIFGNEEMTFSSTNGSIKLYLPENINANLKAKTTNGSIKCQLPMSERYSKKRNYLEGMINDGGRLISIKTTNGSIHLYEN